MPIRLPCLDCGKLSGERRCLSCKRARSRERDRQRGSRQARGLGADYDRNRALLLANALVCEVCGRAGTADDPLTADHKIKREHGGTNTLSNLRAVHASFNYSQGRACQGSGTL